MVKRFWKPGGAALAVLALCAVCALAAFAAGGEGAARSGEAERVPAPAPVTDGAELRSAGWPEESAPAEIAPESEERKAAPAAQPEEREAASAGQSEDREAAPAGQPEDQEALPAGQSAERETVPAGQSEEPAENEPPAPETIEEAKARVAAECEEPRSGYAIVIAPEIIMERLREKYLVDGEYPTTADGRTYGPDGLVSGVHPDLVGVRATNGESGYVKYEEWNPLSAFPDTTPEERARIMAHLEEYRDLVIPVYDLEGNVIGEFVTYSTKGD